MSKLFRHLFESQTLKQRLRKSLDSADLQTKLSEYCKKFDPHSPVLIHRLPKQELREIASMPCPQDDSKTI